METNITLADAIRKEQFEALFGTSFICKILKDPEEYVELRVVNVCNEGLVKIEYKSDSLTDRFSNKIVRWIDVKEAELYLIIGVPQPISIKHRDKMIFSFEQKE